jgi:hypothetical protein
MAIPAVLGALALFYKNGIRHQPAPLAEAKA